MLPWCGRRDLDLLDSAGLHRQCRGYLGHFWLIPVSPDVMEGSLVTTVPKAATHCCYGRKSLQKACGCCIYTQLCHWALLGPVVHDSFWWRPVDTATCQARQGRFCRVGRDLLDTVGFLLWLAGDPGFSGKAGNTCRRLSTPWIVYAGLLKGLAAVKISKNAQFA